MLRLAEVPGIGDGCNIADSQVAQASGGQGLCCSKSTPRMAGILPPPLPRGEG